VYATESRNQREPEHAQWALRQARSGLDTDLLTGKSFTGLRLTQTHTECALDLLRSLPLAASFSGSITGGLPASRAASLRDRRHSEYAHPTLLPRMVAIWSRTHQSPHPSSVCRIAVCFAEQEGPRSHVVGFFGMKRRYMVILRVGLSKPRRAFAIVRRINFRRNKIAGQLRLSQRRSSTGVEAPLAYYQPPTSLDW